MRSLISQDFTDFEVVIADDSPDDSVERLVDRLQINGPTMYHRNKVRLGSPENWNYAVSLARGEYIKILHHDDWLASSASLRSYVKLMRDNPEAWLGFSATIVSRPDSSVQRIHKASRRSVAALTGNPRRLFPKNIIGSPSATIYRRVEGISFDSNLKWVVDVDFYIRMLLHSPALAFTRLPLVCTTNGLSTQVTAECLGNNSVELYEWTYLYSRLFDGTGISPGLLQLKFMWDLLDRCGVASMDDFVRTAGEIHMPSTVARMIRVRSRLAKLLRFARPH